MKDTTSDNLNAIEPNSSPAVVIEQAAAHALVETLEQRKLMSTVSFDSGRLVINGLSDQSNSIQVTTNNGKIHATVNGERTSVGLAGVKAIRIVGGDKDDFVQVSSKITIPVRITGGEGNDRLIGGSGRDIIEGGAGNDTIYGGAGKDVLNGNSGIDRIYGGTGGDILRGAKSADVLRGESGNDAFQKVQRVDRVFGGGGRDTMTLYTAPVTVNTNKSVIKSFILIDTKTNKPVPGYTRLSDGEVLDLSKLPKGLTIAVDMGKTKAQVRFDFDGQKSYQVENFAPYALAGDNRGKFTAVDFSEGAHTITASVYKGKTLIDSQTVNFSVVKKAAPNLNSTPGETPTDNGTPVDNGNPTDNGGNNGGTPVDNGGSNTGGNNNGGNDNNGTDNGNTDNNNQAAPVARIAALSTSVPTGHSIHLDAITSTLNRGDWHEATFEWDFGDKGTKFNTLKGFNASHNYAKPGNYTVTLYVTNKDGVRDTTTVNINITPANRRVIYVSNDGSDSNSGLSDSQSIRSVAKALTMVGDNTEVLFKRGDSFTMDKAFYIFGDNVVVGAYGIGDRPTITWNGARNSTAMFSNGQKHKNITVQELTLDSIFTQDTHDKGAPLGFRPYGQNFTMQRIEMRNLMFGANLNGRPEGVLFQQNDAPLDTGIRKYFVWGDGTRITIIGNRCANSTREHIVRVNGVSRINVSHNEFTNINRQMIGDQWDIQKTALNMQSGSFAYMGNNKLNAAWQIGPLGKATGIEDVTRRFKYAVGEYNVLSNDVMEINHGAEHIMLRNNVFNNDGRTAINVDGYEAGPYNRGVVDLVLMNNTAVNDKTRGGFMRVWGSVDGIKVLNNLYVAPNLIMGSYETAAIKVDDRSLKSFTEIDGNVWPVAQRTLNWVGEQAMFHVGHGYNNKNDFRTVGEWNNFSQVGTDTQQNVQLGGTYGSVVNSRFVGSRVAA